MAKKQKPRVQRFRVDREVFLVSPNSDLDVEGLELVLRHQLALRDRLGDDDYGRIGFVPQNPVLAAAFRKKGLTN